MGQLGRFARSFYSFQSDEHIFLKAFGFEIAKGGRLFLFFFNELLRVACSQFKKSSFNTKPDNSQLVTRNPKPVTRNPQLVSFPSVKMPLQQPVVGSPALIGILGRDKFANRVDLGIDLVDIVQQ